MKFGIIQDDKEWDESYEVDNIPKLLKASGNLNNIEYDSTSSKSPSKSEETKSEKISLHQENDKQG